MPLVNENGYSALLYDQIQSSTAATPVLGTDALMDATAEKVAFLGNVWHPTVKTGTINIRKVLFRTGAVSLNAASEVRVSLQNVSLTAGPPFQPDGSQDQFYDFKTATATLAANSWQSTGNLSADRAVSLSADSGGDANSRRLAVVFEYQVFTAADSVIVSALNTQGDLSGMTGVLLNTGSWSALASRSPILAFECDDGSRAYMVGAFPVSAISTASISSTAAIRRAGVKFRVPTPRTLERVALSIIAPNGSDGRIVVYDSDGTTELRSVDFDNDDVRAVNVAQLHEVPFEPVTLAANTYYRVAFVGGTATASTMNYIDVNAAALMDGFVLGQDAHWTECDSAGTWTDTTTRRPVFGLAFGSFHDGTGSGAIRPLIGLVG